tara:strand:+ start:1510 stop:2715 length:1206 start_codon:yes stop_codon:yes gene_type:complete
MKIRPVILCGGSGTRLWPESNKNTPKQFINFGGWSLFQKTLERIKDKVFDAPIISTNVKYLVEIKKNLKKLKITKYKIILEPQKKNTAPAILTSALLNEVPINQPLVYFSSDHLIENFNIFKRAIKKNKKHLNSNNVILFAIKPTNPNIEYGYLLLDKDKKGISKVKRFIEKPKLSKARKIYKKKAYWNSGIFFIRKDSLIKNFKKYQSSTFNNCNKALIKSSYKKKIIYLKKSFFSKNSSKSFDKAILEKTNNINAIKLNIIWTDLGSWKEISKMYNKNKHKYFKKKNVYLKPWGNYTNIYRGKGFLVKELVVNSKASLSLQKHFYRSEHWMITKGKPLVTVNSKKFLKKVNDIIEIPKGAIHRIKNPYKEKVKIIEVQLGSILKENDIVRYEDIYGRIR